jgi:hypothetical protein
VPGTSPGRRQAGAGRDRLAPPQGAGRRADPRHKRVKYLEENVAASIRLDAEQMRALDGALAPEKVSGRRYSPAAMSMIDR